GEFSVSLAVLSSPSLCPDRFGLPQIDRATLVAAVLPSPVSCEYTCRVGPFSPWRRYSGPARLAASRNCAGSMPLWLYMATLSAQSVNLSYVPRRSVLSDSGSAESLTAARRRAPFS